MRVVGVFMALMLVFMMWNSISSYGWEYLVFMRGLGFKFCVCQLYVILIVYYFDNMLEHDEW